MQVVLDSNVYVSGFRFKGKPRTIIDWGLAGDLDIAISKSIVDDVLRILKDKFRYTSEQLSDAREIMQEFRMVEPTLKLNVVEDDPKDNHIIETAVEAKAEAIVTGDKQHVLKMGAYQGIKMMSVGEFLAVKNDVCRETRRRFVRSTGNTAPHSCPFPVLRIFLHERGGDRIFTHPGGNGFNRVRPIDLRPVRLV